MNTGFRLLTAAVTYHSPSSETSGGDREADEQVVAEAGSSDAASDTDVDDLQAEDSSDEAQGSLSCL